MSKGEKALFVVPAADMQLEQQKSSSSSSSKQQSGLAIPRLPEKCTQVEAAIELLDLVQVGPQVLNAVHLHLHLHGAEWCCGMCAMQQT
jgi:hypothetical protein